MSSWVLGNFDGVALITGAAGGIGRECALLFAKMGAKLVLVDRDASGLEKVKQQLLKVSTRANKNDDEQEEIIMTYVVDLLKTDELQGLFDEIKGRMGTIQYAINCAGILGPDYTAPLHELSESHWDLVLGINLKAQAILTGLEAKMMLNNEPMRSRLEENQERPQGHASERGSIIHLGSIASQHARSQSGAPYISSKHGLVGLTKVTAVTYGSQRIRCNMVAPGFVDTQLLAGMQNTVDTFVENNVPFKRSALPQEIADTILFLCSERAAYITGTTINVDGGSNAK